MTQQPPPAFAVQSPGILVVEDDARLRRSVCAELSRHGWSPRPAPDLRGALQVLGGSQVRAVLLDVHLDGATAHPLAEQLALLGTGIPIVAMSGQASRADLLRLLAAGVDGFIEKPFTPQELLGGLDRAMERADRLRSGVEARTLAGVESSEGDDAEHPSPCGASLETLAEGCRSLLDGECQLPALDPMSEQLERLMAEETVGVQAVLDVIGDDPAVVARVMRAANSCIEGASRSFETPREACIHLGNRRVLALAQEALMQPLFTSGRPSLDLAARELWAQVVVGSRGARELAVQVGHADPERVAYAALIHDIGEVAVLHGWRELLPPCADAHLPLASRELHESVGAAVAEAWGLGPELSALASDHHAPAQSAVSGPWAQVRDLAVAGWLGAREAGFSYGPRLNAAAEGAELDEILARLGVDPKRGRRVFADGASSWLRGVAA